jgi:redox-sensitive bicupin YhaK (pirin superfamily)
MCTPVPRTIAHIVTPQMVMEGAGVRLRRSIGGHELDHLDPFLLFDDFSSENPDDFVAGFPWHPHRGIETVTYILAGEVDHRDSIGNAGSIGAGDCQWMTAGGGIMHEEMPRVAPSAPPVASSLASHGRLAGFQLWVNLPARLKMCAPRYQNIAAAEVPTLAPAPGVRVRVVAGQAAGAVGPVRDIAAEPTYLDVSLEAGATFTQPVTRGQAAFVYVFEGSGVFGGEGTTGNRSDGQTIGAPHLAVLGDGDNFTASAEGEHVRFLLVSGGPLGEPIARYGPFVMNTRGEIEQALRDLREGTFVYGSK